MGLDVACADIPQGEPGRDPGVGEPSAGGTAPGHRRASGVATFVVGKVADAERITHVLMGHLRIAEADLVALVEHRRAAQAQQHEQGQPDLARVVAGPAGGEAEHVVIRARPHRPGARRQLGFGELDDVAERATFERG